MEIRDPSRQRTVEARHQKGLLGPSEHVEDPQVALLPNGPALPAFFPLLRQHFADKGQSDSSPSATTSTTTTRRRLLVPSGRNSIVPCS